MTASRSEMTRLAWVTRQRNRAKRFWDRADRSGGPDACWRWLGARQTARSEYPYAPYGVIRWHGRKTYAHRVALELHLGRPLRPDEHAMHACDNPPCVNPAHLGVGTPADNAADMVAKGRYKAWRPPCGVVAAPIRGTQDQLPI